MNGKLANLQKERAIEPEIKAEAKERMLKGTKEPCADSHTKAREQSVRIRGH